MKAIILKIKILCVVLVICTFLVAAITLINASSNGNGSTRAAAGTLVSIHTETAPTLDGLAKTYAFGIATMDNTGGGGHNTHGSTIYQLAFDIVSEPPTDS